MSLDHKFPGYEVYVPGNRPFLRVRILTKGQYIGLAAQDGLLPTDLIVVDDIPSQVEPHLVAGIISGTRFPAKSHLVMAAEKLGIPLVFEPGCIAKTELTALETQSAGGRFVVEAESHAYSLVFENLGEVDIEHPKIQQQPIDKSYSQTIHWNEIASMPGRMARFGEKISYLAQASDGLRENDHPNFIGVPFGVYFEYLRTVQVEDQQNLENFIQLKVSEIDLKSSPESISQSLREIREHFSKLEIPSAITNKITTAIEKDVGDIFRELRFRSSNDLEDSLGAGIYDSVTIPESATLDREVEAPT